MTSQKRRSGSHTIVDSAHATAEDVAGFLAERDLATTRPHQGKLDLLVTDIPKSFREVASRFLGEAVEEVHQIDL